MDPEQEVRQALARLGVELSEVRPLPVSPYVAMLPRALDALFSLPLGERPPATAFAAPSPEG